VPAQERKPQDKKAQLRQQFPQNLWFWWLIFAVLVAWNLFAWWPGSQPEIVDIPYSTFLAQVRADNISKVHIIAEVITGEFVKSLLWPLPKHAPAKSSIAPSAWHQPSSPASPPLAGSDYLRLSGPLAAEGKDGGSTPEHGTWRDG
jgi:hypothetical protein